jgi:cobalt/nickel transport system permease protein
MHIGSFGISGGWVSFFSILVRFFLTASAALILLACTGFNAVCLALSKLGVPRPFVVQLMFLYRYIFVLLEEGERLVRAQALRSFSSRAMGVKTFVSLTGNLLLRTLERADRIYLAMRCRGFDGQVRLIQPLKRGAKEMIFVIAWTLFFLFMRFTNTPLQIGSFITSRFS